MKKTTLILELLGVLGCMSSVWGYGINAGNLPKEFTPEIATTVGAMNNSFSVSGSRGDVEVKLYKGDTDVFSFTELQTYNTPNDAPTYGIPTLTCEDVTINVTGSSANHWLRISGGILNATNTIINTKYLAISRGGTLNMDGGQLNLTGDRSDLGGNDSTYKISGTMNLNNAEFTAAGRVTAYTLSGSGTGHIVLTGNSSFKGTELRIENQATFSMFDNSSIEVDSLLANNMTISKNSKVIVDSYDKLGIVNLNIVLDSLESINFSDIFISETEGETVVFSALTPNVSVVDSSGNAYENFSFVYDESGNLTGISVPEPSTYVAIIGALALAFAAYRRRK